VKNCPGDHRAVAAAKPHITDIAAEDWRRRDGPKRMGFLGQADRHRLAADRH
jgi:hypothetical protein